MSPLADGRCLEAPRPQGWIGSLWLRLARPDLVDDSDGCAECGLYIQLRGVEQVGVRRRIEGAVGVGAVTVVALQYLTMQILAVDHLPARLQLAGPPLGARHAVGLNEELHVGIRTDDRADVAAIEHGPA